MTKRNVVGRKNLKMSEDVYALRREVMLYVYEALSLYPQMPRVEVRIVEPATDILGIASFRRKHISIPSNSLSGKYNLRHIVFHELVHTVFGVGHDESCELMRSVLKNNNLSKNEIHRIFKKYAMSNSGLISSITVNATY
jgi:hypothetical protein